MNILKSTCCVLGALAVLLSGCSKKETASPAVPKPSQVSVKVPDASADSSAQSAPPPPTDTAAPVPDNGSVQKSLPTPVDPNLLRFVQGAVESFLNGQGRNPTSLEELVQFKYLPAIPAAPAGKKFIFDKATSSVKLVDQ